MKKSHDVTSPDGNCNGTVVDSVMTELLVPSKSRRRIGGTEVRGSECSEAKRESIKQCVDPESTRVRKGADIKGVERKRVREFGSKRADALRRTSASARTESTQPSPRAEAGGLLTILLGSLERPQ